METASSKLYIGNTRLQSQPAAVEGSYVQLLGETYYRIHNHDHMPPFFMSLVSSSDHWLFIASTGGLTAGRMNAESALFPYETEDKIMAHREYTGPKTIIRVARADDTYVWEPFSERYAGLYQCERNLYKNVYGDKLLFEEINHDLQLRMRYVWRTSDRFGFVKRSWLTNLGETDCHIALLDGLQNVLPYGATSVLQNTFSNLLHAYKRNELEPASGLGMYTLSATLTDRAEPSESLQASVVWQLGLDPVTHLLCSDQVEAFRHGLNPEPEQDIRGKAGAYLVRTDFALSPEQVKDWQIVADVNYNSAAVVKLINLLEQERAAIEAQLENDIARSTAGLVAKVAAADGLQVSNQEVTATHHFANVLFNIMRGGIFAQAYEVGKADLLDFVQTRNRAVLSKYADWFAALPEQLPVEDLYARARETQSPDVIRLCYEYLPLTFSRRHGDPSRPWNQFSINLRKPDGSMRLDYQGNWRDIFQNWEPLALSFPVYIEGVIAKFLNACTADGYNPYRVTRDGVEWEVPEPNNPWANIGYWSDHQIIYLQKLLEIAEQVDPTALPDRWNQAIYAYCNVPYRLKTYEAMLANWYDTIEFDWATQGAIEETVSSMGTDGRLHRDAAGQVIHVTMVEKLLTLLLAKLTNLVPEGGIWMNTQRPEWNDANNALVGKGLSVVTVAYLRRFINFWVAQLAQTEGMTFSVNTVLATLFEQVQHTLIRYQDFLKTGFSDEVRKNLLDEFGEAITAYRSTIYADGLPATQTEISGQQLQDFLTLAQAYIEQTLHANRRSDNLYHAYNILRLHEAGIAVDHLYLMLEGQVAILSSGMLSPDEVLRLLQNLRHSDLYRADQHSYMLYPNRDLPGFLQKNNVTAAQVTDSGLVAALTEHGDQRLLICDDKGVFHFNGHFRNAGDVAQVLDALAQEDTYAELVTAERDFVLDLFERTFDHRAFTGRSGTFFAYEGLGSIYWHMVAKLLLAVQECYFAAANRDPATLSRLEAAYYDIRRGLGFSKLPQEFGAFPTDPYSHTPARSGARQPGMTGQVKEEILTRLGELGVHIHQGQLYLDPKLLRADEFLPAPDDFVYIDVSGQTQTLSLPADSLAFTFCQTPVIYSRGSVASIEVTYDDGRVETMAGPSLSPEVTQLVLNRTGRVQLVRVIVVI